MSPERSWAGHGRRAVAGFAARRPRLARHRLPGTGSLPVPPTVGLVLSGGGSGAGFQLGALRYLYDEVGIAPSVITGTSAGSILASLLAQGDDHASQRRILSDIERVGAGLRQSSDMLTELDWFSQLRKLAPSLQRAMAPRPARREPRRVVLPPLGLRSQRLLESRLGHEVASPPTVRLPTADPALVRETLGLVWTMSRSGADFEALLHGIRTERSMFKPGPIFDQLLDPGIFDPERLAASKTELRIAVVGLESGELRYATGTGVLVDRENRPLPGEGPVAVVDAIHASCAIPAVYPPVRLGSEHYVDGGIRENAPVEIAVAHLAVDRCYAIVAVPRGLSRESSYADKDILSIVLRSTAGVMADELQLDDVARARAAGATIIAPEINLLDMLDVDPGLLALAMDYGYLRAAEACEGATPTEQARTRQLVETRRAAWVLENDLFGPPGAGAEVPASGLDRVVALKRQLRELVAQMPSHRLPPGAADWWTRWEEHQYPIAEPVTWAAQTGAA